MTTTVELKPKVKRAVKKMLMEGFTLNSVFDSVKDMQESLTYNDLRDYAHNKLGWNIQWRNLSSPLVNKDRHELIETMKKEAEDGLSLQTIGDRHELTRERVRQILGGYGINVRDLKKNYYKSLAPKLFRIQSTAGCIDKAAAEKLNISINVLNAVKGYLTPDQKMTCAQAKKDREKRECIERLGPAIKMWDEGVFVAEIAKVMETTTQSMHQAIMRYRKRYGLFPPRQGGTK